MIAIDSALNDRADLVAERLHEHGTAYADQEGKEDNRYHHSSVPV